LALAQDGGSTYNLLADEILIHGTYLSRRSVEASTFFS
jgi:hypothetical protein